MWLDRNFKSSKEIKNGFLFATCPLKHSTYTKSMEATIIQFCRTVRPETDQGTMLSHFFGTANSCFLVFCLSFFIFFLPPTHMDIKLSTAQRNRLEYVNCRIWQVCVQWVQDGQEVCVWWSRTGKRWAVLRGLLSVYIWWGCVWVVQWQAARYLA